MLEHLPFRTLRYRAIHMYLQALSPQAGVLGGHRHGELSALKEYGALPVSAPAHCGLCIAEAVSGSSG